MRFIPPPSKRENRDTFLSEAFLPVRNYNARHNNRPVVSGQVSTVLVTLNQSLARPCAKYQREFRIWSSLPLMRNRPFLIWVSLSLMRNSQFLIWSDLSPMRNSSFLIGVWLPLIRNDQFLIWGGLPPMR